VDWNEANASHISSRFPSAIISWKVHPEKNGSSPIGFLVMLVDEKSVFFSKGNGVSILHEEFEEHIFWNWVPQPTNREPCS